MNLFSWLGLASSDEDEKLKQLVKGSYKSVQVVGRGTVKIDPKEVHHSSEFRLARAQAKAIVGS